MPFRDVVNQHHAILLLRAAVRVARPAHAYLFVGPAGTGRRLLALGFAQFLNCQRPADGDACGECRACRRIAERNHPDVRVLDIANGQYLVPVGKDYKGKEIPIDQIRALKQDAYYPPYEGRTKVYIIADAELLSLGAANSLLKVLEEPPPNVIIILIAETTVPLPATITSRCQFVRCALIPTAEIERVLVERHGASQERARFLAALAAGRIGRAVAWAQSAEVLERRDRFLTHLVNMETADPLGRLDAAEELTRTKEQLPERVGELLEIAALWYRDLAVWKETQDPSLIINLDRRGEIEHWAAALAWDDLARRIEATAAARDSLERNVQPRILLESLFFKIAPQAVATTP
ncbi:MAG: DnaX, DNA polymerase III, gamma/tau subunit, DNA polymerase III subunit delta' [Chloroflexi bacterium CSP1-4]|nr:MAG: DnaX, DNA polymerase III, gamma/tau subunit, DNA polymerase III subunit delta' [Chloroflexi bacterium CSP1-4]